MSPSGRVPITTDSELTCVPSALNSTWTLGRDGPERPSNTPSSSSFPSRRPRDPNTELIEWVSRVSASADGSGQLHLPRSRLTSGGHVCHTPPGHQDPRPSSDKRTSSRPLPECLTPLDSTGTSYSSTTRHSFLLPYHPSVDSPSTFTTPKPTQQTDRPSNTSLYPDYLYRVQNTVPEFTDLFLRSKAHVHTH